MKKITHSQSQDAHEIPSDQMRNYSGGELFEFANTLESFDCPNADLAVAFAAYIGMNVEVICSAWEYRFYNASAPRDNRGKVLANFDEIVALIKRHGRT
jgi:hypothetical protein